MDSSRENVKRALIDLVARKDAAIFQNLDTFEQAIRKVGNLPLIPEITALRGGLQQRLPWELQKASAGPVPGKTMANLTANLARQHNLDESLAAWAVESWAAALNIKYEAFSLAPVNPINPAPLPSNSAKSAPVPENMPVASDFSVSSARVGVIFGISENGQVKVFKSWSKPTPSHESAGMVYTPVKIEERVAVPLFAAAPGGRTPKAKTPPKPLPTPPKAAGIAPVVSPEPVATTTKNNFAPRPTMNRPAPAPVSPPPVAPAPAPVIRNGTAEELFAAGQSLMPGFGSRVNMAEAIELFNQAARMGYVPARRKLGEIYLKGLGVKTDCAIAAGWFRQAADAGDAQAQFHLGSLHQCGMGVEFSLPLAQEWLQKAAKQGHQEAKELLNQMLQA